MAINLVVEPGTGTPIDSSDYNAQNNLISACEVPRGSILDDWTATSAEPLIKQGTYISHAGNTYQVDTADEEISGSCSSGLNYIVLTLSGTVITAAWATSIYGYSWNPAYGGYYDTSGNQALLDACYLDGTAYHRVRGLNGFNIYYTANGRFHVETSILTSLTVEDDLSVGGDVIAGGRGDFDKGIVPAAYFHGTDISESSLYSTLSAYVTSSNPHKKIIGSMGTSATTQMTVSRVSYYTSTSLRIYGVRHESNEPTYYTIDSDGTTTYEASLSI